MILIPERDVREGSQTAHGSETGTGSCETCFELGRRAGSLSFADGLSQDSWMDTAESIAHASKTRRGKLCGPKVLLEGI